MCRKIHLQEMDAADSVHLQEVDRHDPDIVIGRIGDAGGDLRPATRRRGARDHPAAERAAGAGSRR